jgi:hypothetical protein
MVPGLVVAVALLAGCGSTSVSSPTQSPQSSPSTSLTSSSQSPRTSTSAAADLQLFRDPLGGYVLRYDAHDLAPGPADPTAADYWGRRSSYVVFHPTPDSGLAKSGFILVKVEDAKGELTAAEAGRFWAKQFRENVYVARLSGATFTQPPRVTRSGAATVYITEKRKGSGPTVRSYQVVEGTRSVTLTTRVVRRSDLAHMRALSMEMTASLRLQ